MFHEENSHFSSVIPFPVPPPILPANHCADLVLNGYNDWFLPSRDELDLMYKNLHKQGLGGFGSYYYWSSSEYASYLLWEQDFSNDSAAGNNKSREERVRAVRAF